MSAGSRHEGAGAPRANEIGAMRRAYRRRTPSPAQADMSRTDMASCLAPRHVANGHGLVPGTTTCRERTWPRAWHHSADRGGCYGSPHGRPTGSASEIRFVRLLSGSKVVG